MQIFIKAFRMPSLQVTIALLPSDRGSFCHLFSQEVHVTWFEIIRCHVNLQMGPLSRCICYIHLQSLMAWDQENIAAWTSTSGSIRFGNSSVQNQAEGVDKWHSQEAYSGMHDCGNLCHWVSKAWVAACTHSHLLCRRLQATHGRGCRPHAQCWIFESRDK